MSINNSNEQLSVGICQFDIEWENSQSNILKINSLIKNSNAKFDWLIFPEMTLSGFSMNSAKATLSAEMLNYFVNLAKNHNIFVSFGGVRNQFNQCITINPQGIEVSAYSKQHLFALGHEKEAYLPGTESNAFTLNNFQVLPTICYDLRFSYMFWKPALNTHIYTVIASWPQSRDNHWRTLLQARAIENQAFVIGVNRIGSDPNVKYCGSSLIVSPQGNILCDAANNEGIFTAQLSMQLLHETRSNFPFLRDRLG